MGCSSKVGEGELDVWDKGVTHPGRLAVRPTFLEEMVMEEMLVLFWGISVVTSELDCVLRGVVAFKG